MAKNGWITHAPRRGADALISMYQRYLSPHKGYTCAHLVDQGGLSCSAAIRRIIAERGLILAVVPTIARLHACYRSHAALRSGPQAAQGLCCCGGIPIPFRF